MKLFKNKVGRPSNEILKRRRLFNLVISLTFMFLVSISMLFFKGINLKGMIIFGRPYVLYSDNVLFDRVKSNDLFKVYLNFRNLNKKQYYYKADVIFNGKTKINVFPCKKINLSKRDFLKITMKVDSVRVKTYIYNDSECKKLINTSKSKTYKVIKNTKKLTTKKVVVTNPYKTTKKTNSNELIINYNNSNLTMGNERYLTVSSGKISEVTVSDKNVIHAIKISDNKYKIRAVGSGGTSKIYVKSNTGNTKEIVQNVSFERLNQSRLKNGIAYSKNIGKTTIYVENGCNNSYTNKMITDFIESPDYIKRAVETIFIVKKSTLQSLDNTSYGITLTKHLNTDLSCDTYYPWMMSHEIAHIADGKYLYYTGSYLSYNNDWTNLYNANNSTRRYLRPYSYSDRLEFFADSYSYYFHKNLAKTNKINNTSWNNYSYSNDIKNEVEKSLKVLSSMGW